MTSTARRWLLVTALLAAAVAASGARVAAGAGDSLLFHHLHLNDPDAPFLLQFYERLFDPAGTRRLRMGDADGLQSGSMLLVISHAALTPPQPSAVWHFGWGGVSLGETYLAHAAREVAWDPPLPPERLHLHIRSGSPPAALAWYRDVLGARVEVPPDDRLTRHAAHLPAPEHRTPEGLVWLGGVGLLVYRADPPLMTTRGQTVDHVALSCANLDDALARLRAAGVQVGAPASVIGGLCSAMIEGPDRLAIELVEAP